MSDSVKYFVSASTKKEQSSFEIVQDVKDQWKIVPPVPEWIEQLQSELIKLIQEASDPKK